MASVNSTGEVSFDFRRVMGEWRIPNIDLDAVAQCQRRNLEALTHANQLALEGTQTWVRRNLELARQSMEDLQAMLSEITKPNGSMEDRLARQAEFSRKAIEKGLENFRGLTELMTKANADAMNVITQRMSEGTRGSPRPGEEGRLSAPLPLALKSFAPTPPPSARARAGAAQVRPPRARPGSRSSPRGSPLSAPRARPCGRIDPSRRRRRPPSRRRSRSSR